MVPTMADLFCFSLSLLRGLNQAGNAGLAHMVGRDVESDGQS